MNSNTSLLSHGDIPNNHITSSRQAVIDRMVERHNQAKAVSQQRRQTKDGQGNDDFLSQFLQYKATILDDLESTTNRMKNEKIPVNELTKFLDDIMARLEYMQKWLNEMSLYLTPFDSEQARIEFKNLNSHFQATREKLLPTRKFNFTHKTKALTATQTQKPTEVYETEISKSVNPISYDPRFSFINIQGPKHLILPNVDVPVDEISGELLTQSVYLENLVDCTVEVRGVCGNFIARQLKGCKIYVYPVAGSVWLEDCVNSDLVLACRQLRIHQTSNCRLSLYMASRPIIEASESLTVAPYQLNYPMLEEHLKVAGLSTEYNFWREVEDFSCPNKRLTTGSPNWCIMPENEWPTLIPKSQ